MHHEMKIDYDKAKNRFLITCPMWANELVKALPSRRWLKGQRAWAAPLLRRNVDAVADLMKMPGVAATPAAKKAAVEYKKQLNTKKAAGGEGMPAWYKFKVKPRKHQHAYFKKSYGKKAFALHADRGTGKTFMLINKGCALRMEGKIDAMLVVVKLSGRHNWKEQLLGPIVMSDGKVIDGWATIPVDVFLPDSGKPKQFEDWLCEKHDFKVMVIGVESLSQGNMIKLAKQFVNVSGKVFMIIDESHLVCNHKSIRTNNVIDLGKQCEMRETSTGSPISTGPLNLFSEFEFLDPDIIGIGDYYAFRNRYAVILQKETKQGKKFPLLVGYQNIKELTDTIAPYTFEVRKDDVLPDLPKKSFQRVMVQMTAEQRKIYNEIRSSRAYSIKGKYMVVQNVLELALRLHTVCGGYIATYIDIPYIGRKGDERLRRESTWHAIMPPAKNPKITELLDIAEDDKQMIIWAAYKAELNAIVEQISNKFPNEKIVQIHGGIKEADRAVFRKEYQSGKAKFMIGNTATGGSADTWTACETMIYYNNTERMIDREQSEDRAHRDGLTHPVLYIDLIAENSVDELIIKSNEAKMDLAEYIRRNIREAATALLA